jgi:hypothetical protein
VAIQKQVVGRILRGQGPPRPPLVLRLAQGFPLLQRLAARLVGLGVRPEHVRTPEVGPQIAHS